MFLQKGRRLRPYVNESDISSAYDITPTTPHAAPSPFLFREAMMTFECNIYRMTTRLRRQKNVGVIEEDDNVMNNAFCRQHTPPRANPTRTTALLE